MKRLFTKDGIAFRGNRIKKLSDTNMLILKISEKGFEIIGFSNGVYVSKRNEKEILFTKKMQKVINNIDSNFLSYHDYPFDISLKEDYIKELEKIDSIHCSNFINIKDPLIFMKK